MQISNSSGPEELSGTAPAGTGTAPGQNSGVEARTSDPTDVVPPKGDNVNDPTRQQSAVELWKNAQRELVAKMTRSRLRLLAVQAELDEVNAKDDYEQSLLETVKTYGSKGITVSKLHVAFGDSVLLTDARKALEEKKLIQSKKDGQTLLLTAATL